MIHRTLLLSLLAAAVFCSSTNASTIIVDSVTGADNRAAMVAAAGQTFTTGVLGTDNRLSSISILGDPGGAANTSTVSAELRLDTDGDFTTWDPGTLVASSTNSQVIAASNTLFTFNFSNELLSDNTVYVLSFSDGIGNHVAFRSALNSGGDSLANGALFSGGVQPFGGAYDASIQVVGVPEVSTLGLLIIAGLGVSIRRRRR